MSRFILAERTSIASMKARVTTSLVEGEPHRCLSQCPEDWESAASMKGVVVLSILVSGYAYTESCCAYLPMAPLTEQWSGCALVHRESRGRPSQIQTLSTSLGGSRDYSVTMMRSLVSISAFFISKARTGPSTVSSSRDSKDLGFEEPENLPH